jgi:hypothetical protein
MWKKALEIIKQKFSLNVFGERLENIYSLIYDFFIESEVFL